MKKILFSTMIASLLAFVGCQNEELVNETTNTGGEKVILTANIQGATDSRVVLTPATDDEGKPIVKVAWREYDENNPETFYVAGENGEFMFTQVSDTEFSGTLPEPYSNGSYQALYNLDLWSNFGGNKDYTFEQDGTLREQDMMMIASFNEGDTSIEFQHMMSILKPTFRVGEDIVNNTITHIEMGVIVACSTTVVIDVKPTAPATTLENDVYLTIPTIDFPYAPSNFKPGETFNFAVTANGKDYTGSLTIPQIADWDPVGKLFTATIALTEVIPYVTFKAASEQTLDLVQTESQMLDDEDYPVYKDDEESIPVLVPNPYPGYDGDTGYIEYSVGNSNVWTKFTPESEAVEFGGEKGDLRLRGISPKGTLQAQIVFGDTTSVACSGDIRTLVDWGNYATAGTSSAIFRGLFKDCSVLTSAPELPATTLAPYCYYSMFVGCTRLNAAPALPATDLAENCYKSMFYGCTSLKVAPELPATTLANQCYGMMFAGCTNLAAAPVLSATNLANDCYNGMFVSCTSLTSAPVLSATILANNCYNGMFNYCINLASAPELPATTLKPGCYAGMFMNCTSLTSAPELPATTLVDYCYHQMFIHCTNLNRVTMLATDISASNCLTNWMSGVSATGTFTKAASMTTLPTGESGIPSGWTVQNYVAPGEEN